MPPHRRPTGDAGFSLLEVTVGMAILSVVTAIAMTGIVQIFRTTTMTESAMTATANLHTAFTRLDDQLRYASAISAPADLNGVHYVEYATTNTGTAVCTQLRLDTSAGSLQSRTQRDGEPVTAWSTLATGVSAPGAFTRDVATTDGLPHQQLTIVLTIRSGDTRKQSTTTFTALNTSAATADATCTGMDRS